MENKQEELKSAEEILNENSSIEMFEYDSYDKSTVFKAMEEYADQFKKQLKEKEQESIMLEKMCNRAQDHAEGLLKQLTKSNEMNEMLAEELEYWDEFNDVLTEYQNSKK